MRGIIKQLFLLHVRLYVVPRSRKSYYSDMRYHLAKGEAGDAGKARRGIGSKTEDAGSSNCMAMRT